MFGAILAVGSALLGMGSSIAKNHADAKQQKQQYENNKKNALADGAQQLGDLSLRRHQEIIAGAQQMNLLTRSGMQAAGSLQANAAANNVEGNTVDAISADVARQQYDAQAALSDNLTGALRMVDRQGRAVVTQTQGRIDGVTQPGSTALGDAFAVAGGALGIYSGLKMNAPPGGR